MVVGKTSVSKTEIFSKFSETQVLCAVFPEVKSLPCLIPSPLRADKKPSFSIYMTNGGHIAWKDHAKQEDNGTLVDLLCKYWNCSFLQALEKLCELPALKDSVTIKPKQIKTFTRKEIDDNTKIQVTVRPWKDYDYDYWASYGIGRKWLKYAEIYPISHKIIKKKDPDTGKVRQYVFAADKYAYCFVERKDGKLSLKIYQPYNKKGFKWCSKMDSSVIALWTKVPESGDRIVICSSVKDALCLSCNLHIPAIALQGEGYRMSKTAVKELKKRYKKIFICYDTDAPGKADAEKFAEETGFCNVVPDLGKSKDLSDYYKSLKNKEDFKKLEQLFH